MLSYKTVLLALLVSTSALALPVRREVPQEHSHEQFLRSVAASLQKNNPDNISDPVFGLLGAAAAAGGAGKITDTDCLQQATADQAFTNAKAAGDVKGMSDALIYRALERNTLGVGVVSKACTSIKAKNPEIAALQQHQDPASDNAKEVNKAIEIELAKQLKAVGGNPKDALLSATFKPGDKGDSTAKGFTCDDANDAVGCIISGNLLVPAATEADIDAAVGGAGNGGNNNAATPPPPPPAVDNCPAPVTVTVTAAGGAATAAPPAQDNAGAAPPPANNNFNIGNFGKCSVPEIEFAAGFDGRKETSFQPSDLSSFNHGSAQNIKIITQFICDTLTNSCGADQTAKDTCAKAKAAADAAPPKQGIDADTFNGFFGIATNFRNTQAIDDQGRPVAGSTGGSVSVNAGRRRRHL